MYNQDSKVQVRKKSIGKAVKILTEDREKAVCVRKQYVKDLINFFSNEVETIEQEEVEKITEKDLCDWETLHESVSKKKSPDQLKVCYLSGPDPENDFKEFIKLGVLPQNIWAFESNKYVYESIIDRFSSYDFSNPKIIKYGIEHFFKDIPQKFDIVYIDACGAVPSKKHALRCFSTLCHYHRITSPGIVITNYSSPEGADELSDITVFKELLAIYFFCKFFPNTSLEYNKVEDEFISDELDNLREKINENFDCYYGDFLTNVMMDISSVIVPQKRFINSTYIKEIILPKMRELKEVKITLEDINNIKNNSLFKFISIEKYLRGNVNKSKLQKRLNLVINEMTGFETKDKYDLYSTFYYMDKIRNRDVEFHFEIKEQIDYFNNEKNIHQFLDKSGSDLFVDFISNQIGFPLHTNIGEVERYLYKAKQTKMFTDVIPLDECRYIYDWLPTINQIDMAFNNKSLQYIFRFGLDGLIKNRMKYSNGYFFKGSVISKNEKGFEAKTLSNRFYCKGEVIDD